MTKKIIIGTTYSFIVFCIISYFSVMYSLLQSVGNLSMKPVTNIGFPFKYYYQFWLSDSDSPNCGWNIDAFFYDVLITWIIVTLTYLIIKRIKAHNKELR